MMVDEYLKRIKMTPKLLNTLKIVKTPDKKDLRTDKTLEMTKNPFDSTKDETNSYPLITERCSRSTGKMFQPISNFS
jgi:hypothetical protein